MNTTVKELIKKAYGELKEAMIAGLERGDLNTDEMRESARYIQNHLDETESLEELILLLHEIGDRWPAYKTAYITFKQTEAQQDDQQKMEALQEKLRQFAAIKH